MLLKATHASTADLARFCAQLYIVDAGDAEEESSRPDISLLEELSEQSDDSSGSDSDSDDGESSEDEEERSRKRRTVGEDGEGTTGCATIEKALDAMLQLKRLTGC